MKERMQNTEIPSRIDQRGQSVGGYILEELERKRYSKLRQLAAWIDGMDVLAGGRWFRSKMECVEFATKNITEGHFQWFIDIVIYLQFVTGDTVYTEE